MTKSILIIIITVFSPFLRSVPDPQGDGALLSPLELQQQLNITLRAYGKAPVKEDGIMGAETCRAYHEVYSLQLGEDMDKGYY